MARIHAVSIDGGELFGNLECLAICRLNIVWATMFGNEPALSSQGLPATFGGS